MKKCPYCAEEIQDEAIVCKHCGRDLNPLSTAAVAQATTPPRKGNKAWWFAVPIGFFLSFFGGGLLGPGGVGFFVMWIGMALAGSGSAGSRWIGGFILACVLMVPGFLFANAGEIMQVAESSSGAPRLELLASNGELGEHYSKVNGQVKNLTAEPFDNIKVVVTWLAADGTFIVSDSALIDYRPLMPGQTSPFSTITSTNPLMKKYRLEFTTFRGAVIGHRDSSGK